jgi:uncharacterized protein YndB with AHSA1/START domain
MSEKTQRPQPTEPSRIALIIRRTIKADPVRVFEAWTRPEHLLSWWGPRPVRCAGAEVDLRVGGRYRIENDLPDGARVTIAGEFRIVEHPRKLVYTWNVSPGSDGASVVTVRFEPRDHGATEVIVVHEEIATPTVRESHEKGWDGCLEGLARHFAG